MVGGEDQAVNVELPLVTAIQVKTLPKKTVYTEGDTLKVDAHIKTGAAGSTSPTLHVKAAAADNTLMASLGYNNHSKSLPIHGALNAEAQFYKNTNNVSTAHVDIKPSVIHIGEKPWKVHPADITYSKNHLEIENFEVSHGDQHVAVNGLATPNKEDSIVAQLKDVDVEYILNLVNFHSVDFSGKASGKAIVKSIFNDPDATQSSTSRTSSSNTVRWEYFMPT